MPYEDIKLGSIWHFNYRMLEVVGLNIGSDRVIRISYRYLGEYDLVCDMPVSHFLGIFEEHKKSDL